jgi:hypothetical protein
MVVAEGLREFGAVLVGAVRMVDAGPANERQQKSQEQIAVATAEFEAFAGCRGAEDREGQ